MGNILLIYTKLPQDSDSPLIKQYLAKLPESVAESSYRYRTPARRLEFLAGRWLLQRGLKLIDSRKTLDDIVFSGSDNAWGKPFFEDGPFFSISHSRGLVACAISNDQEVGLDVEAYRPIRPENLRNWFTADEMDVIQNAVDPETELMQWWTIKEALFKGQGEEASLSDDSEWRLVLPNLDKGYSTALVVRGELMDFFILKESLLVTTGLEEFSR